MKRVLDCGPADFEEMDGGALLEAVRSSEGRTILCEVLWPAPPLVDGVSNAEVAVAFGADLVLLNMFGGEALAGLKRRLGRPVGVNVEPSEGVPEHRRASRENLRRLAEADFVVVTPNPARGRASRRCSPPSRWPERACPKPSSSPGRCTEAAGGGWSGWGRSPV